MSEIIWFVDKKFRATVLDKGDYSVSGYIDEVVAWDETDESGDSWEYERYLKFYMKWDACCHINFGQESHPGYLHLCEPSSWHNHCQLMQELFDWSVQTIPKHMDKEKNNA
jgi:hypothetical protein